MPIEKAIKNGFNNHSWRIEAAELHKCYESLIFSHDFAKAFFPKEDEHGFHKDDAWKFYLQQMVIEEKPLSYLVTFL